METRSAGSRIGAAIGYGSFCAIAGVWLFVSWWQWHGAGDWWRDYQSQWNDAAAYDPVAVRRADERAFLLDLLIVAATVAVLVGVVLIARRRRAGPAVAGAIAGVAFLVTLAVLGSAGPVDRVMQACYDRNPETYVEGTGLDTRGWSLVDGGVVAIWRGHGRTLRVSC